MDLCLVIALYCFLSFLKGLLHLIHLLFQFFNLSAMLFTTSNCLIFQWLVLEFKWAQLWLIFLNKLGLSLLEEELFFRFLSFSCLAALEDSVLQFSLWGSSCWNLVVQFLYVFLQLLRSVLISNNISLFGIALHLNGLNA